MKSLFLSLKINTFSLLVGLSIAASAALLPACMAPYDAMGTEYVNSISTKLPALMNKATEAYSKHETEVSSLNSELDKVVAHAASMKKNKEVAESWRLLQTDLVAPFIARWKDKGKLDKDFIKEATMQVTKSLDAIKRAEAAKKK
ncbi:MAG: hypothetical protein LCH81_21195 [Bacteroidetes bacterium]|nr:hypothetical protein [Bacteroidota bacterium]